MSSDKEKKLDQLLELYQSEYLLLNNAKNGSQKTISAGTATLVLPSYLSGEYQLQII